MMSHSPLIRDPFEIVDSDGYSFTADKKKELSEKVSWYITVRGTAVKVKRTGGIVPTPPKRKDTKMGPMSRNSRLRLLTYLNTISWQWYPVPTFVTLTYPDTIIHRDYRRRSLDRYLFLRYLEKYLKENIPCIWRVEWKPRLTGRHKRKLMPHWHLLLPTVNSLSESIVREFWRKAIGHDDTYLDVDVRQVEGTEAACRYIAKYVSKGMSLGITAYHNSGFRFGRHWGVTRKPLIRLEPWRLKKALTADEVADLRAHASSLWPWYDAMEGLGFTLLGSTSCEEIEALLD